MNLRDISESDFERTVWRYMPFPKFVSLLTYKALWFSKLNILEDEFEGCIPEKTKQQMSRENEKYKTQFNTREFHRQIDSWPEQNEDDGRELTVVSCWFLGEYESHMMWSKYGGSSESIAVKSTVGRLYRSVAVPRDVTMSHLGPVSYVDHAAHSMTQYEAHQALERAFLKDKRRFSDEQELRIATLNFKTTACVAPDGNLYTAVQVDGIGANNFDSPGLYISVDLCELISDVVVSPTATDWFFIMVRHIVGCTGVPAHVSQSSLRALIPTCNYL
jgi:hypothetical protein